MQSYSEENYLKAIYHLSTNEALVQTNAIAEQMQTKAASVTDMLKKLADKSLIAYTRYQGAKLTEKGRNAAIAIIRKHRLWEVFLVEKLKFGWDEVHDLAEELEHISSDELTKRLDDFLGYPSHDPHGDPIPDASGNFSPISALRFQQIKPGESILLKGVSLHSSSFLQHLDRLGLKIGSELRLVAIADFDQSVEVQLGERKIILSENVAKHLIIDKKL